MNKNLQVSTHTRSHMHVRMFAFDPISGIDYELLVWLFLFKLGSGYTEMLSFFAYTRVSTPISCPWITDMVMAIVEFPNSFG